MQKCDFRGKELFEKGPFPRTPIPKNFWVMVRSWPQGPIRWRIVGYSGCHDPISDAQYDHLCGAGFRACQSA